MKKKLMIFSFIYIIIMLVVGQLVISHIGGVTKQRAGASFQQTSVEMNEIKQLISTGNGDEAMVKCDEVINSSAERMDVAPVFRLSWIFVALNILAMAVILMYVYFRILKPFEDMKSYANEISKGNMNVSIKMDRGNYFGDFTWAFENMRKEILKSRNAEKNAIENNKTVIATLSHDIKTPVASIRAYAEAFEANMDSTPEKRQKYLSIMMEKCDEVSRLTNDLFVHSISEMNKLDVDQESFDIVSFMDTDVRELFVDEDGVNIKLPEDSGEIMVKADRKRLLQIIENLKSNADKYAKSQVDIVLEKDENVKIHFRDYGPGIAEEEIPFITGKFYRGKNAGDENGSGLGLYIVEELVGRMDGSMKLLNRNPGLEVIIDLNESDV